MKTTIKCKETFAAVPFMRQQRDRLSKMLSKMSKAEIVDYFHKKALATTVRPSC